MHTRVRYRGGGETYTVLDLAFRRVGIAGVEICTSEIEARVQHETRGSGITIQDDQVLLGELLRGFELRKRNRTITEHDRADSSLGVLGPRGDLFIARRGRLEGASFVKGRKR
jgi:hypothetical protein